MLQIWIRWRQGREGRSQWWRWICGDLIVVADSGSHPPQPEKRQGHLSCKQSYREKKKKRKRRDGDRRPKSVDRTFVITRERSRCRRSQVMSPCYWYCQRSSSTSAAGDATPAVETKKKTTGILGLSQVRPWFGSRFRSGSDQSGGLVQVKSRPGQGQSDLTQGHPSGPGNWRSKVRSGLDYRSGSPR